MNLPHTSHLCLASIVLGAVLLLGGCAAAPRAAPSVAPDAAMEPGMPSSSDGADGNIEAQQREVDALMAEIARQKSALPAQPANPTAPPPVAPGPAPDKPTDDAPQSDPGHARTPQSGYRAQCDTVASAICTSSEQICTIAARHPNDAWFSGRCLNASADCAQAKAACSEY